MFEGLYMLDEHMKLRPQLAESFEASGAAKEFICPYHQWTYDLAGNLIDVPFRRGLKKEGGMPASFRLEEHGLRKLTVTTRRGVIFASFAADMPSLEDYLGADPDDFDATFDGRKLEILATTATRCQPPEAHHENLGSLSRDLATRIW
jgi:phenylpropionate dioxygenase-like ring-hydroxylating dioxygenase large terminal subunit